jgi:hypothetical protein
VAQVYPQTLGSLLVAPTTHRATVEVFYSSTRDGCSGCYGLLLTYERHSNISRLLRHVRRYLPCNGTSVLRIAVLSVNSSEFPSH